MTNLSTEKLNLCMPPDMKDRLLEMKEATGCTSMAELVRRAFSVYELLYGEIMNEGRVILEDLEGDQRQLVIAEFEVRKDEDTEDEGEE